MEIVGFNEAAQKVFDMVSENKVYEVKGATVKLNGNKKFSAVKSEYQLMIDPITSFREVEDDGPLLQALPKGEGVWERVHLALRRVPQAARLCLRREVSPRKL